jgi:uncharacterized OB-fold protein
MTHHIKKKGKSKSKKKKPSAKPKIKPEKIVAERFDAHFKNPIEEVETKEEFKNWGSIGGRAGIVGHKIIKGPAGHRMDLLDEVEYMIIDKPYDIMYHHSYGLVSKFFMGLKEKKIYGTRCPKCGDTFCAPRAHCWRQECKLERTEWIELPKKGMLHSYTILGFAAESFLPKLPFILGYVRIDGCNTMLAMVIEDVEPTEIECDTPVRIKFVDEPKGTPMDMYAVPARKPKSRKTEAQKRRMKKQFDPIRKWTKKRFG